VAEQPDKGDRGALLAIVAEGFFSRLSFGLITFALPLYAREKFGLSLAEVGLLAAFNQIVAILLKDVQKRLGEEELTLRLTPAGSDFLVERGYDEHYGARPLKRAIQKFVEDPLSEKILVGEFARGDEIEVDVAPDKERLAFRALSGSKA